MPGCFTPPYTRRKKNIECSGFIKLGLCKTAFCSCARTITGVVFEWELHNLAYHAGSIAQTVGNVIKSPQIVNWGKGFMDKGGDLDFENTLFDDTIHGVLSKAMHVSYNTFFPLNATWDGAIKMFK